MMVGESASRTKKGIGESYKMVNSKWGGRDKDFMYVIYLCKCLLKDAVETIILIYMLIRNAQ